MKIHFSLSHDADPTAQETSPRAGSTIVAKIAENAPNAERINSKAHENRASDSVLSGFAAAIIESMTPSGTYQQGIVRLGCLKVDPVPVK